MQNNYINKCNNAYVYSFSLKPTNSHLTSFGYCSCNDELQITNLLQKSNDNYTAKCIIRYYDVIKIKMGSFMVGINNGNFMIDKIDKIII
jgi:hypothetical protein